MLRRSTSSRPNFSQESPVADKDWEVALSLLTEIGSDEAWQAVFL
jgi:hypothetical protein